MKDDDVYDTLKPLFDDVLINTFLLNYEDSNKVLRYLDKLNFRGLQL